jgi:hypothetical protein
LEGTLEEQNYDPYAELNSLISKEDEAQSSDRRNPKKPKKEKPTKDNQKKGKPKKEKIQKEKRKGPFRWILLILILLCLAFGAIYFVKPKPIMRQINQIEKIIRKMEKKSKTAPKKNASKSNTKNVSDSDTKTDQPQEAQPQKPSNDGFSYQDGAVKVVLCGNTFDFPFAPNAVADKGWNGISVNADPDNASFSVSTWTNVDGSTLYLYYPSNMDGAMVTKAECSFVGTASSFLGLSMSKSTTDCDSLFSDAERKDTSGLDTSGNGTETFYYKTCRINVSFQNGFVTSCSIEKM